MVTYIHQSQQTALSFSTSNFLGSWWMTNSSILSWEFVPRLTGCSFYKVYVTLHALLCHGSVVHVMFTCFVKLASGVRIVTHIYQLSWQLLHKRSLPYISTLLIFKYCTQSTRTYTVETWCPVVHFEILLCRPTVGIYSVDSWCPPNCVPSLCPGVHHNFIDRFGKVLTESTYSVDGWCPPARVPSLWTGVSQVFIMGTYQVLTDSVCWQLEPSVTRCSSWVPTDLPRFCLVVLTLLTVGAQVWPGVQTVACVLSPGFLAGCAMLTRTGLTGRRTSSLHLIWPITGGATLTM